MVKNIIFDFDGTLVDTSEGIIESMHYAFDKINRERVTDQEIREVIGPPLPEMLEILLKTKNENLINEGVQFFRERYAKEGLKELKLYKGVRETLQRLISCGMNLFIVTSKPHAFVVDIATELEIIKFFRGVSGVNINGKSLDKSQRITKVILKYELKQEDTVMVGDRCEDIRAAKANNLKCIGVTYGFGKREDLTEEGMWMECESFRDILEVT